MKSILELYAKLNEDSIKNERFVRETFVDEVYKDSRPKLTVVDLGAFTGEFSFYCLPFASKIYAVEPDPVPFDKLQQYIKEFELEDNIKIFNYALGAKDEMRSMNLSHGGGSTFDSSNSGPMVQTYSFKTFIEANKINHIDILKVDIEDGETEIFSSQGFIDFIPNIDLIIGEHGGFGLLKNLGYKVEEKEAGVFLATK